jgi:hypothetical protein
VVVEIEHVLVVVERADDDVAARPQVARSIRLPPISARVAQVLEDPAIGTVESGKAGDRELADR